MFLMNYSGWIQNSKLFKLKHELEIFLNKWSRIFQRGFGQYVRIVSFAKINLLELRFFQQISGSHYSAIWAIAIKIHLVLHLGKASIYASLIIENFIE